MTFNNWAYIYLGMGEEDPAVDRAVIERGGLRTTMVAVAEKSAGGAGRGRAGGRWRPVHRALRRLRAGMDSAGDRGDRWRCSRRFGRLWDRVRP